MHSDCLAGDLTLPEDVETLGQLSHLIGTWGGAEGISVTAMPAPNDGNEYPAGFVLDAQPYEERLTVRHMSGAAPNRGGPVDQFIGGLTYEQVGHGPGDPSAVIHMENGMFLNLTSGRDTASGGVVDCMEPARGEDGYEFVRNSSVPHGNMASLFGRVRSYAGAPSIPDLEVPADLNGNDARSAPYRAAEDKLGLPILNPNASLQDAVRDLTVKQTIEYQMSSRWDGGIVNVPFIKRYADTIDFDCTIWVVNVEAGPDTAADPLLLYTQSIGIAFAGVSGERITLPHVTTNIVRVC